MPHTWIKTETRQRARTMRNAPTAHERKLWKALRLVNQQGFKFRRQAPIGPFIGDFVDYGLKLVVELDGGHHTEPRIEARDSGRSRWLESQGFTILRFWNGDIDSHLDGIVETIFQAALQRHGTPPLAPPHKGEGNDRTDPHA